MHVLLIQTTIQLTNYTMVLQGATDQPCPPVSFEPMTPVHVLIMDHTRQQVS